MIERQHAIDYDTDRVFAFVKEHVPYLDRAASMRGMGLPRGGELVAGVLFEGFNGFNLWMHAAARDGHTLTRYFLSAIMTYPFAVCRVERVRAQIAAGNAASLKAAKHLGFKEEARLSRAAQDGGDLLIMAMTRQECRYYV